MITIIFAPPRKGKTSFMSHVLNMFAYDYDRNRTMQKELLLKQANGFHFSTIPTHCVSANYSLTFRKFGYSRRYNRFINPYRLGFFNENVKTHFMLPYEVIGITEAQKYLNSRMSLYFPDWQSRFYEQHGHNNLDIFLDTQRPNLIDVNIRELSSFIEIRDLKVNYYRDGGIKKVVWTIRKISDSRLYDVYVASGGRDTGCYEEETVVADYDVFSLYDSFSSKPKFYEGHFEEDFDLTYSEPLEDTYAGYLAALKKFDDEYVEGFYQKRSAK